jgi:hypothetical protein
MDELTDYEKLVESVHQMAGLLKAYYDALKSKGFKHYDAMLLITEYQKSILEMVKINRKDDLDTALDDATGDQDAES